MQNALPAPPSTPVLVHEPHNAATLPEMLEPGTLIPLLALVVVLGTWGLLSGHATIKGNELSKFQVIFSATNAATLTGFQQAHNPNDYTGFGQLLTFVMMLAGIFFSFVAGGLAVVRIARMRFGHWQIIRWTIGSTTATAVAGALALHGADRTFLQAGYQAVSAFGNCGLYLGSLPDAAGARVQLIVLPLSLLGGFGLPVIMEIVDWLLGKHPLSRHSGTVLVWSAGAYCVITILLILLRAPIVPTSHAIMEMLAGSPGAGTDLSSWQRVIASASREAINARSTGFPFEFATYLPQTAATILILVMIVGAGSGGTAGGLKLTTLATMSDGIRDLLHRRPTGRPLGMALLWTLSYLATLLLATLALLVTEPGFHLDRTLFLAASALGNVGLSHDPIVVSDAGLCVLSITMLLGRVAPVVMLWYVVKTTPEATMAIG